jgi:tetratricopeptide (TPR) repeat protein
LAATAVALWRKPAIGFVGAWFFILLAPSSSFVPLATQTMAEHRMYLPLAALVIAAMFALTAWLGRRAIWMTGMLAILLGGLTIERNRDYRSDLEIWTDTVAHCPGSARAHGNLGRAYLVLERWEEALAECQVELRMDPTGNGDARINIGRALTGLGRPAEALPYFEDGLHLKSDGFDARNKYGIALAALGRWPEAIAQYEAALRLQPDFAELHNNLANALARTGRLPEALVHYAAAMQYQPDFVEAEVNWARALAEAGQLAEALPHFEKVVRLQPQKAEARHDLAVALAASGRLEDAVTHFEETIRLQPDSATMHFQFAVLLGQLRRWAEAIRQDEAALRLQPDFAEAREHLAWLRQQ